MSGLRTLDMDEPAGGATLPQEHLGLLDWDYRREEKSITTVFDGMNAREVSSTEF